MLTAITQKAQDFSVLCRVLERNDIFYERNGPGAVTCRVSGQDGDISITFSVNASKMLVTALAPVCVSVLPCMTTDAALAVCIINNKLPDGGFCFDVSGGMIFYRLSQSYYNSGQTEFLFEYMLSCAAEAVDKYRPGLKRLMRGSKTDKS